MITDWDPRWLRIVLLLQKRIMKQKKAKKLVETTDTNRDAVVPLCMFTILSHMVRVSQNSIFYDFSNLMGKDATFCSVRIQDHTKEKRQSPEPVFWHVSVKCKGPQSISLKHGCRISVIMALGNSKPAQPDLRCSQTSRFSLVICLSISQPVGPARET